MAESSASQLKFSFNVPGFNKVSVIERVTRLSNAICIENMVKKNSMFAPPRLQPMHLEKPLKAIYNLKLTKCKRQIQSNQTQIPCNPTKSMSSFINKTKPQSQDHRHKRNISAIWQNKKMAKERKLESQHPPTTASFYLKKGDNPIFYQLKMDIKKVGAYIKPIQVVNTKGRYRSRNYPTYKPKAGYTHEEQDVDEPFKQKASLQIPYRHELIPEVSRPNFQIINPVKPFGQKQRYIKSTLVSYSSKLKLNKSKQSSVEIVSDLFHIKNIMGSAEEICENFIELVQPQALSFTKMEPVSFDINNKTANSFSLCHFNSQSGNITPIFMKDSHKRVEIASITKIMTCYLVLSIAKKFRLNIRSEKALISERASKMPGTSAALNYSDILTIYQLLHALMLPSGNDAAVALAEWGGKTIRKYCSIAQKYSASKTIDAKSMKFLSDYMMEKKSYQRLFIHHMNKAASKLKLYDTRFANVHGLMNDKAYSTSHNISLLTCIAMKNNTFAELVGKKEFSCKVYNRTFSQYRNVSWKNTNRLLNTEGFVGVKTGVTPSAGPCLASMFRTNSSQFIVVVVLKTKSMELRFKQSLQLIKQGLQILNLGTLPEQEPEDLSAVSNLENEKFEQANLVQDQKQLASDQENEEDEEDGIGDGEPE